MGLFGVPTTTRNALPGSTKKIDFTNFESDPELLRLLSRYPNLRIQLQSVYGLTLEPSPQEQRSSNYRGRGRGRGRGGFHQQSHWSQAKGDKEATESFKNMRRVEGDDQGLAELPLQMLEIVQFYITRFAEAVTRQLFSANADVLHLRELNALSSYNKLRFIQATVPTNHTNVLREGFSYSSSDDPIDIGNTRRRDSQDAERIEEDLHGNNWQVQLLDDDNGDRICHRCDVYYKTYNEYPTPEEVDRLATRAANLVAMAANHPPPGVCQNGLCGMDGNSTWHWSFAHGFYLCDAC
ncbi:unnamed protein product [Aureobasidium pullulans]|nr:unnamed protein product [Aureobasidium pullulans]